MKSFSRTPNSKPSRSGSRASTAGTPSSPKLADPGWTLEMDPHGIHERRARSLAAMLGEPAHLVVEEAAARAWARHCAGQSIEDANLGALSDIAGRRREFGGEAPEHGDTNSVQTQEAA